MAEAHAATPRRQRLLASVALLPLMLGAAPAQAQGQAQAPPAPQTLPTGGQVVAGGATIASPTPGQLTITQTTQRAAIDWQSFSVGQQGHVQFQQPNSSAIALNRVTGPEASVIAGRITANGQVAIVNQSGVVFTPTARVDVGALVASAAGISNENFMAGRMVFDQAPRPGARVVNEGRITVAEGGLAALVAPEAANRGTIEARLGRVVIGGAETYALDLHGDGLLSLEVRQPSRHAGGPAAANTGTIAAEGGTVLITAEAAGQLVQSLVEAGGTVAAREGGRIAVTARGGEARVTGTLDARATAGRGGDIAVTGTQVAVAPMARIDASGATGGGRVRLGGDVQGQGTMPRAARTGVAAGATVAADATVSGQGGTVVVWADEAAFVHGRLSARGGPQGGDGGFVETSAARALSLTGLSVDTSAPAGRAGTWLIDPIDLTIGTSTSNGTFDGSTFLPANDASSATLAAADIIAGLANNDVVIATTGPGTGSGTITVLEPITWSSNRTLTFTAAGSIILDAAITGTAGGFSMTAGGTGQILQTAQGTISVAQFSANAPGGIALAVAPNALPSITALGSTGGAVAVSSTVASTIQGAVTAGGAISLSAPGLTTQALTAANGATVTLLADTLSLGGAVTATGGRVILAPRTAGRQVTLGGAGGGAGLDLPATLLAEIATDSGTLQIGNGAGTGAITIAAATTIAAPTAGTLELRSGGAITQAGALSTPGLVVSGASVTLEDAQNEIARLGGAAASSGALSLSTRTPGNAALIVDGPVSAGGALSLAALTGGLDLRSTMTASGAASLSAAGSIVQTATAVISAPSLTLSATGAGAAITLGEAPNVVPSLAGVTIGPGGGNVAFRTTGTLAVTGALSVPGTATLSAGAGLTQTAAITAASLGVSAGAAGIVLDDPANAFATLTGAAAAGGPITVLSAADLAVTGTVSGSAVRIEATGGTLTTGAAAPVTATSGAVTLAGDNGVTLGATVAGAGGVTITSAAGNVQAAGVSSSAGAIAIEGNAVTAGAVTAQGAATVTARTGALALTGTTNGSAVTLQSTAGTITAAGTVTATAGAATISAATGATLAAVDSSGDVTITATAGNVQTGAVASATGAIGIEGNAVSTGALAASDAVSVAARNGGNLAVAGAVTGETVTLSSAGGSVAATAGAPITASAGTATVTASGDVTLGAALAGRDGVTVRSTGGDVTTASLASASGAVLAEGRAVSLGAMVASGDITVSATTAATIAAASAGGDVTASAPSLTLSGPAIAGAGRTLSLVADTFSAGGTLGAVGGTIALRTVTPGRAITLGAPGPGLALTGTTLGFIAAGSGTLSIGAANAGPITLAGPVELTGHAGRLVLTTGGSVAQAGRLEVARLSVTAGGGIGLGLAANTIGVVERAEGVGAVSLASTSALSLEGNVTGNGVTLASGGPLSLTAPVDAGTGTLSLTIAGAVTQTAGAGVTAARLTGTAHALGLGTAANAIGGLGPFTAATGPITLSTTGPLALEGTISTPGALSLTAGGPISAGAGLAISAASLTGGAAGGTDLGAAAHAVPILAGWTDATGGLAMRVAGVLAITGDVSLGGALSLTAGGAIAQAGGTAITATALTGGAAGGTSLASPANAIAALGPWADGSGGLTLATTTSLALEGTIGLAGTLDLSAAAITQDPASAITAPRVTASGTNGISLDSAANTIAAFGPMRATGGDVALATTGPLLLDGVTEAGGTLSLTAGGAITQTARITAARLAAEGTGGITLGRGDNAIGALDDVLNTGSGNITLRTTTGLAVDGRVFTPAALLLEAGGAITQGAAGAVEAATLSGRSAGGLTLDRPANRIPVLTGWTNTGAGGLALVTGSALTVTGVIGPVSGALLLETRGAFPLSIATPLSSDVSITGLSGGTLSLGGHRYAAPAIAFRARAATVPMSVGDAVFAAASSVVLAATGSMEFTGTTRVEPLTPGDRPAVVLSVRSGDEQTDVSRVRPDAGGLPDLLQFTQVERFVPPSGATRNTLSLGTASFLAPASPLFLVIDAGTATGRIEVARLGLITAGGSADLTGCVNGVCGPNAASLGRSTDPSSLARLNNCPVSSPNCLDFPTTITVVTSAPPELPQVVTERRFEGVEIPLSDVADEDE